jgi:hypothetical protein
LIATPKPNYFWGMSYEGASFVEIQILRGQSEPILQSVIMPSSTAPSSPGSFTWVDPGKRSLSF